MVLVRETPVSQENPFGTDNVTAMIRAVFPEERVVVGTIPDIESVNYGRGVGYEINEYEPPTAVHSISATQIRDSIRAKNDRWKQFVPQATHTMLERVLG